MRYRTYSIILLCASSYASSRSIKLRPGRVASRMGDMTSASFTEVPLAVTQSQEWFTLADSCLSPNAYSDLANSQSTTSTQDPSVAVAKTLENISVPFSKADSTYLHVKGTLLVFSIRHCFPYNWNNIKHVGESAFPTWELLEEGVDSVLLWQIDKKPYDWIKGVGKMLGKNYDQTTLFFKKDLSNGICADKVIAPRKWPAVPYDSLFTSTGTQAQYRAKVVPNLGLSETLLTQQPACTALVLFRALPQGWKNAPQIQSKLQNFMKHRNWKLKIWAPGCEYPLTNQFYSLDATSSISVGTSFSMSFRDQVELFADVSLSIMPTSAENANLPFQPPKSAIISVNKCGENSFLKNEAARYGFDSYDSYPADCSIPFSSATWNWDINEHGDYTMDFEHDLVPVLEKAMTSLERRGVCRPDMRLSDRPII